MGTQNIPFTWTDPGFLAFCAIVGVIYGVYQLIKYFF